jgi:hypothetical protein
VTELRAGGWDATEIAEAWQARFAPHLQASGIRLPKLDLG